MKTQRTDLRWLYALQHDGSDPWGSAIGFHFGICDVLTFVEEDVPSAWQFRAGAGSDESPEEWPAVEILDYLERGLTDADELRHFGSVLSRYTRLCDLAGHSY